MQTQIDLAQLDKNHKYELSVVSNETPEDAIARRTQEEAEASQKIRFCSTPA